MKSRGIEGLGHQKKCVLFIWWVQNNWFSGFSASKYLWIEQFELFEKRHNPILFLLKANEDNFSTCCEIGIAAPIATARIIRKSQNLSYYQYVENSLKSRNCLVWRNTYFLKRSLSTETKLVVLLHHYLIPPCKLNWIVLSSLFYKQQSRGTDVSPLFTIIKAKSQIESISDTQILYLTKMLFYSFNCSSNYERRSHWT